MKKRLSIQLAHTELHRANEIADSLRSAGFTVHEQIPTLGRFYGEAEEHAIRALEAVAGVKSVKPAPVGENGEEPSEYSIS